MLAEIHRSPLRATIGPAVGGSQSSGVVFSSPRSPSSTSISPGSNPVTERSRLMVGSRTDSSSSSAARISRSHPARSANLLSASTKARSSSSDRPRMQSVGTSFMPAILAAACRAWPARIMPDPSMTITPMKPTALIVSARFLI